MLRYTLLVTGAPYGTQNASTAYQFALAVVKSRHQLCNVFFHHEGVLNSNRTVTTTSDDFDLVRAWTQIAKEQSINLYVCTSAAFRRGILNEHESQLLWQQQSNLQEGFILTGLGELTCSIISCDRFIQF